MIRITTKKISPATTLSCIISDQLAHDFPFGARKLPLGKRFVHSVFLTDKGIRTVDNLRNFLNDNYYDVCVYTTPENIRELCVIMSACYKKEELPFLARLNLKYAEAKNLNFPYPAENMLFNDLFARVDGKDFTSDLHDFVLSSLNSLNELERSIVQLYYGIETGDFPRTAAEIAKYYRFNDESTTAEEIQFIVDDCLKIMRESLHHGIKTTETSETKTVPQCNLLLSRKIEDLEKKNSELDSENSELKRQIYELTGYKVKLEKKLVELAKANEQLEQESSDRWKRASTLENENKELERKLKDLEAQHKEKSIKLINANYMIENSQKALAVSIYKYEQLRQFGPIRCEIYQIAQDSLTKRAKSDPITAHTYESQLPISKDAHDYLKRKMCFTYEQILSLIVNDGWGLMASVQKRPIITEIMFAINYNPAIKQASINSIGLSTRSRNALSRSGLRTTEDVKEAAINGKLYEIRNLGAQSLEEVLIKTGLKQ